MNAPETSTALPLAPTWCPFQSLPSDAAAAIVATRCFFSLATLEVSFSSDSTKFALVEREQADVWRWAVYSCEDIALDEGREPSQAEAHKAAEHSLRPSSG